MLQQLIFTKISVINGFLLISLYLLTFSDSTQCSTHITLACCTDEKKTICILSFQDTLQEKKPHHPESAILNHSATRWILLRKVQNSRQILAQGEKKKQRRKNKAFCVCAIYWCILKCSNLCLTKTALNLDLQLFSFLETLRKLMQNSVFQPDWHLLFCSATLGPVYSPYEI